MTDLMNYSPKGGDPYLSEFDEDFEFDTSEIQDFEAGLERRVLGIKKWKPRHDIILSMHLSGLPNIAIAEAVQSEFGWVISKERVCQILGTPQAQARIVEWQEATRQGVLENIQGRLLAAGDNAMKAIESTLALPMHPLMKEKKHQDTVALSVLGMLGFTQKPKPEEGPPQSGILLSPEAENRLVSALEKSARVEELHGTIEGEVVEEDDS